MPRHCVCLAVRWVSATRPCWTVHLDAPRTSGDMIRALRSLAWNHPFIDGNKRTALLAMRAFLFLNGHQLTPDEIETVTVVEGLAAGTVDEASVESWIESNTVERGTE